jgi:hypothetical protein
MQIKEFREKYPEYDRIHDDQELAFRLWRSKYRSKDPYDFAQRFGVALEKDRFEYFAREFGVEPTPKRKPVGPIISEPWVEQPLGPGTPGSKSQWEQFVDELPGNIGAAAGAESMGYLWGQVPAPPMAKAVGYPVAWGTGAFIGGGGGEAIKQLYKRATTGKHPTLEHLREDQFQAAVRETIYEAIGRGAGYGLKKALWPGAKTVIPDTSRLSEKLQGASLRLSPEDWARLTEQTQETILGRKGFVGKPKGAFLDAAQRTESRAIDFLSSSVEGSLLGGGGLFTQKRLIQPAALRQLTKETADEFWRQAISKLSREEAAELFIDTTVKKTGAYSQAASTIFSRLDQISERARIVDLRPVTKNVAKKLLKEADQVKGVGMSQQVRKLASKVAKWDDAVDFKTAHAMRSSLLEEVRKLEAPFGQKLPKVRRAAQMLAGATDQSMAKAARAFDATHPGADLYKQWRAADLFVKGFKRTGDVMASTVRAAQRNPSKFAQGLFVPHSANHLSLVKKAVGEDVFNTLRASWLDSFFEKMARPDVHTVGATEGVVRGKTMMQSLSSMGNETLDVIFENRAHREAVFDVARLAEIVQKPTGAGAGILMKLVQAGAIVDAAMIPFADTPTRPASAAILIGPGIVGKILAHPTGAKWLSEGLGLGPNVSKATAQKWIAAMPIRVIRILRAAYLARNKRRKPEGQELRGFGGRGF